MFLFLLFGLVCGALLKNGLGKKPCCDSSSSSSSSDCDLCPRVEPQLISLNSNDGVYPVYYGVPNSGYYLSQTFFVETGPYGGVLFGFDCFCPGDEVAILANDVPCTPWTDGVRDEICEFYQDNPFLCVTRGDHYTEICDLAGYSLYNITMIQKVRLFGNGSGYVAYFNRDEPNVFPCGENLTGCNWNLYEPSYPRDFGN